MLALGLLRSKPFRLENPILKNSGWFRYVDREIVVRCVARAHSAGTTIHQALIGTADLPSVDVSALSSSAARSSETWATQVDRWLMRRATLLIADAVEWMGSTDFRYAGAPPTGDLGDGGTPSVLSCVRCDSTVCRRSIQRRAPFVKVRVHPGAPISGRQDAVLYSLR